MSIQRGDTQPAGTLVLFFECEAGHIQGLLCEGLSRQWAETQAGLLDGSSRFFVHRPGPDSIIGKCSMAYDGIIGPRRCGKQIKATVLTPEQVLFSCSQCSRPQAWDGSGLCSWRNHPDLSCDGRQVVSGKREAGPADG